MTSIHVVSEDSLSECVATKIVKLYLKNHIPYPIHTGGGKSKILRRILQYNKSAKHLHFFIIIDLDREQCLAHFIKNCFKNQPLKKGMIFRVAVREIESWILADINGFYNYFTIPKQKLSSNPDKLNKPKQHLVNIIDQYCKKRTYKENIIPYKNSNAIVGPGYNSEMIKFIHNSWNVERARKNSESLNRCIMALKAFHSK